MKDTGRISCLILICLFLWIGATRICLSAPTLFWKGGYPDTIIDVAFRKELNHPRDFPLGMVQTKKYIIEFNTEGEEINRAPVGFTEEGIIGRDGKTYLFKSEEKTGAWTLSVFTGAGGKEFSMQKRNPWILLLDAGNLLAVSIKESALDFYSTSGELTNHYYFAGLVDCSTTVSGNSQFVLCRVATRQDKKAVTRFILFTNTGRKCWEFPIIHGSGQGLISSSGEHIALLTEDRIYALDGKGELFREVLLVPGRRTGAISEDGQWIALYEEASQEISLYSYKEGKRVWKKPLDQRLKPLISHVIHLSFLKDSILITLKWDQPIKNRLCLAYLLDIDGRISWHKEYPASSLRGFAALGGEFFAMVTGRKMEIFCLGRTVR